MALTLPPVYPITDKRIARANTHLAIVRELVRGGATLVQIRDKETPVAALLHDLRKCVEFAEKHSVRLLVNDRCDLALGCNAAGVHLGQEDLPPEAARRILGETKTIGYSTHTLVQARQAQELPVDYIAFGPVFSTATKSNVSPVVGLQRLRRVCNLSIKPVVAIGGIDLERIRRVLATGASSAAVISALMNAKSLSRRMEQFLRRATEKP